jgi:hypothetical protein
MLQLVRAQILAQKDGNHKRVEKLDKAIRKLHREFSSKT